jgi:hypothetical protein
MKFVSVIGRDRRRVDELALARRAQGDQGGRAIRQAVHQRSRKFSIYYIGVCFAEDGTRIPRLHHRQAVGGEERFSRVVARDEDHHLQVQADGHRERAAPQGHPLRSRGTRLILKKFRIFESYSNFLISRKKILIDFKMSNLFRNF